MTILARLLSWYRRRVQTKARAHAIRSLLCSRCSAPLFENELATRLCAHCERYGSPRPLGKSGTTR